MYLLNFGDTPFNRKGSGQCHVVLQRSEAGLGEGGGGECLGGGSHGRLIGLYFSEPLTVKAKERARCANMTSSAPLQLQVILIVLMNLLLKLFNILYWHLGLDK
jgi:hypothetical protein